MTPMATKEDVRKLAALARITIEEAELEKFTKEFDAIIAYMGQLEKLELPSGTGDLSAGRQGSPALRNVMREDGEPHATGAYTEKVASQFPQREGDALVVKQIIERD